MSENRGVRSASEVARAPILLKYTCAAYPPDYVNTRAENTFGRDAKGFYWESAGDKHYADIDFIKMLFTPKSITWDEAVRAVK